MQHDTRYLFLSMTISGVACFLFFRFAYPYHLLHREQMLLFTYTVDQFIDYFNHPAPLSCLGGDFLTQFFHNINMGAAVVALTMAALGTLTYFTCRKWTNRWIAIGISIVVFIWESLRFCQIQYPFSATLSLIGALSLFLLTDKLKGKWDFFIGSICGTMLCYSLFGYGMFAAAMTQVKYYSDLNADGTPKTEVTAINTADNLKKVKYAVFAHSDYQATAAPGAYVLNMKFVDGENELKKVVAPVTISVPTFTDLFTKVTSVWNADKTVLNALLVGSTSADAAKQYVMTNAFKSVENSGADWNNLTLTPKKMSISGTPTEVATYAKVGSILAMADALLDANGAVRGNVTVDGTYLVKGKTDLKVEVPAFAVNFMSPFNDAVLNFYKGGKVVDLNVAIASDGKGTIAKVAGDAGKEAGLQLVASSEKVAVSEDMELFGATNDKFTFVVKGDGVPAGATATLSDAGIALTGMSYGPNYSATLEMTVTALNGIKTTITLPMTINKP